MSHTSANLILRKYCKDCAVTFDDLDCATKVYFNIFYQLAMLISHLYYSLVLLITFLERLSNISHIHFVKTKTINHSC